MLALEGIVQLALSPDELLLAVCQPHVISCFHWSSFQTAQDQAKPLCTWTLPDDSSTLQVTPWTPDISVRASRTLLHGQFEVLY